MRSSQERKDQTLLSSFEQSESVAIGRSANWAAADVAPYIDGYNGCRVVFDEEHPKSIAERVFLAVDLQLSSGFRGAQQC